MIKKILLFLLATFIIIQIFRPSRNNIHGSQDKSADISAKHSVPMDIQMIVEASCYDCHSNKTIYPWYYNIQPVGWWLDYHISEGKKELNFNEFSNYSLRKQYHKMEEIEELVEKNEMPLRSYTFIHTDSKLSQEDKEKLINWAKGIRDKMKAIYPADSLLKK